MVRTSQRTLYMADIQLHQLLGKDYTPLDNTTLNEKFSVLSGYSLPSGTYPTLNYFAIGVGGETIIDGDEKYKWSEHGPMDGALFEHIPWVMRNATTNDLTNEEKLGYRLRTTETINGVKYACYYLKVIPQIELKQVFYAIRTTSDDITVSSPTLYVYDTNVSDILNPTPRTRSISYDTIKTSEFTTKSGKLYFSISEDDIVNLQEVLSLRDLEDRNITEIGCCTGIDTDYSGYKEVLAAQLAIHLGVNLNLAEILEEGSSFRKTIDIGGYEPLII